MAAYRRINAATQEEVISSLSFCFFTLFLIIGSELDGAAPFAAADETSLGVPQLLGILREDGLESHNAA
jgi:hypothetical protein